MLVLLESASTSGEWEPIPGAGGSVRGRTLRQKRAIRARSGFVSFLVGLLWLNIFGNG